MTLLKQIFAAIDRTTINTFDLAHCTEMHKVGLLGLMKNARRPITKVYLRQHDEPQGTDAIFLFLCGTAHKGDCMHQRGNCAACSI